MTTRMRRSLTFMGTIHPGESRYATRMAIPIFHWSKIMVPMNDDIFRLSNGEITMWIENETSLHIKCVTKEGDPVELNFEEVEELCIILHRLGERIK